MNIKGLLGKIHTYVNRPQSMMLMGIIFGPFGSGKSLYLTRTARKAMDKCVNCGHIHPYNQKQPDLAFVINDKTGKRMLNPKFVARMPCPLCRCKLFKGIRVFTNLKIVGTEMIGPEEFLNVMTEEDCEEFKGVKEFDPLEGKTIVDKFEKAGFLVIKSDEVALVCIDEVWCVSPETMMLGDNKLVKDLTAGDTVVTSVGLEKTFQVDELDAGDEIQEVKVMGCLPMRTTGNHPFEAYQIIREYHGKNYTLKVIPQGFVRADTLQPKKDYVAIPILQGSDQTKISRSEAWLLGLYTAEGSTGDHQVYFSLNENEKYLVDKIEQIKHKHISVTQLQGHAINAYYSDKNDLKNFPEWCGHLAEGKQIPDFILYNQDLEILRAYLEGYFIGDGYFVKQGIETKTTSQLLALQLQLAIARFGIPAFLSKPPSGNYYRLVVNELQANKRVIRFEDKLLFKVISSELQEYSGQVYNVVAPSHTFLVSNVITHNTWADARMSGSKQNVDMSTIILQSRKKGIDIAYVAQLPSSVEKRMRLNTEFAVIAKKIKKRNPISHKMEVSGFRYVMATDANVNVKILSLAKAKKYYEMYNTRQSLNPPTYLDQEHMFRVKMMMEFVRKRNAKKLRDLEREMEKQLEQADVVAQTPLGQVMELDKEDTEVQERPKKVVERAGVEDDINAED